MKRRKPLRWARLALGLSTLVCSADAYGQNTAYAWSFAGTQPGAHLGHSVASAGDVNGDGYGDVLAGAPGQGMAYLFLGSPSGLAFSPAWSQSGGQAGSQFGFAVAPAGDLDGDGYDDVLVGAPGYDDGQEDVGAAFLFLGSSGGLSSTPSRVWQGNQAGARFGASVHGARDVNSDGHADVIVGAPGFDGGETDEGSAFLFLGTASVPSLTPAWSAEGNQEGASLGAAVVPVGDMNEDGFADVAIGAPLHDNGQKDEGQVRLFAGNPSGLGPTPLQSFEQNVAGSRFGTSVSGGENLSGDGAPRILFGAPMYQYTHVEEGGTFMALLGQAPFFLDFGRQDFAHRGTSISSAGDVNADGREDVVIGADLYDQGEEDEGLVTVHLGHPSFVVDRTPAWTLDVDQSFCAFGFSVASAGDVNGDGYDDIVVGAPRYDQGAGDEGRAFVYLGPSGTVTSVDATPGTSASPALRSVGPNPFREGVRLVYTLPRSGKVHLSVFDVRGRQRAVLVNAEASEGRHSVTWDGRDRTGADCAAGIYFVRLAGVGTVTVRQVLKLR